MRTAYALAAAGLFVSAAPAAAEQAEHIADLPAPLYELLEAASESSAEDRFADAVRLLSLTQAPETILTASARLGREGEARAALGIGPAPVDMGMQVAVMDDLGMPPPDLGAPPREPADESGGWLQAPAAVTVALAETIASGRFALWSGRINAGLRFDTGNTEREDYILGLEANRELSGWGFRGSLDYAYSEVNALVGRDWFRARARGEREAGERFTGYATTEYERDVPASADWTAFVGGGVGYRALRGEPQTLTLRAGPGMRFIQEPGHGRQDIPALDLGADYMARITESITFTSESNVLVSEIGRADQQFSLNSALNEWWSVQLKHHYRYEFDPQPGFGSTDQRTDISIVREF
jgi:putative salt-induced outer membrane protein YdiY